MNEFTRNGTQTMSRKMPLPSQIWKLLLPRKCRNTPTPTPQSTIRFLVPQPTNSKQTCPTVVEKKQKNISTSEWVVLLNVKDQKLIHKWRNKTKRERKNQTQSKREKEEGEEQTLQAKTLGEVTKGTVP